MIPERGGRALVPPEIERALASDVELRDALKETGLPVDFQAMVLGLATFRRINPKRSSRRPGRLGLHDLP